MSGLFQVLTIFLDVLLLGFLGYYIFRLRAKEKMLGDKESKIETTYKKLIENALERERKVLDEANKITAGAEYINRFSKGTLDKSMEKIVHDIENEMGAHARGAMEAYGKSLQSITDQSINDFESATKGLKKSLEKQLVEFPPTMLSQMEKELIAYKEARLKKAEQLVTEITQTVSQEVLNKAISAHDHKKLLIQALEKAKKEGVFE